MDGYKVAGLKNGFYKIRKVFLILLPQIVICELLIAIFKDFKINVVVNAVYRRKVDFLTPLLLTFINLLAYIYYII